MGLGLGEVRGRGRGLNFGAAGAASRGFTSSSELVRLEWRIESMEKERGLDEETVKKMQVAEYIDIIDGRWQSLKTLKKTIA